MAFVLAVAGCNNGTEAPDARIPTLDGSPFDAPEPPDARPPDAPPPDAVPEYSGTISVQTLELALPPGASPVPVKGFYSSISFSDPWAKAPSWVAPGSAPPIGCFAWEYDVAAGEMPKTYNAGTVKLTGLTKAVPDCKWYPSLKTYLCATDPVVGAGQLSQDATLLAQGAAAFAVGTGTPFTADDVGRYMKFVVPAAFDAGGEHPFDGKALPIVTLGAAPPSPAAVVYIGGALPMTPIPFPANTAFIRIAGAGPLPNGPDILDDSISVELDATGAETPNPASFTEADVGVASDFTLPLASIGAINGVPTDGSAITIGCDETVDDAGVNGCGDGTGTILLITTTDANLAAGGACGAAACKATDFPPPVEKQVEIRCSKFGVTQMTVPAEGMAFIKNLKDAGKVTKIRAFYLRNKLTAHGKVNIVAGHGRVGFTTVP